MQNQINLPATFLDRLRTYVPDGKIEDVLNAFSVSRPTTFRVNTLRVSSDELINQLQTQGFEIEKVNWYPDAFILENKSKKELMETQEYKNGEIYIQNLSSMIPPLVINPQDNEIILDMAAAPGSKTTQLALLMHNKGKIVANDKSPKRIFKLIENLKQQNVGNTQTISFPGEFLWKRYPEYFDKVLIDVPCSMEGRFHSAEPDSYKDWSPKKIKELSNLQKWLLRSAITCTKVDGIIVYSTCAMDPQENEEVIDWILRKAKGAVVLESVEIPNLSTDHGLTFWKNKKFSKEISKTLRIYPSEIFEGFFIAKLRKVGSTVYQINP